eukprot:scaffold23090_cov65-Phaeocystis_antarctica.AAC.3
MHEIGRCGWRGERPRVLRPCRSKVLPTCSAPRTPASLPLLKLSGLACEHRVHAGLRPHGRRATAAVASKPAAGRPAARRPAPRSPAAGTAQSKRVSRGAARCGAQVGDAWGAGGAGAAGGCMGLQGWARRGCGVTCGAPIVPCGATLCDAPCGSAPPPPAARCALCALSKQGRR